MSRSSRTAGLVGITLVAVLGCRGDDDAGASASTSADDSTAANTTGAPARECVTNPNGGDVCFVRELLPAELDGLLPGSIVDLDADGSDELVLLHGDRDECGSTSLNCMVVARHDADAGVAVLTTDRTWSNLQDFQFFRADADGDGREDVWRSWTHGSYELHVSVGDGVGPREQIEVFDGFGTLPVPIDVDLDGMVEVLAQTNGQAQLFRRSGDEWLPVGEGMPLPNCHDIYRAAVDDFDGDGADDVAVLGSNTGCDPYPVAYDPDFHVVSVLRSDPATGILAWVGSYPTGGISWTIWSGDVDGDGITDLVLEPYDTPYSILRGRGDATFDAAFVATEVDGEPVDFGVAGLGDMDRDGVVELIITAGDDAKIIGGVWSPLTDARGAVLSYDAGWITNVGDVDGDGRTDVLVQSDVPLQPKESGVLFKIVD